ncbi:hypothetical protein LguiB_004879 [Lonicera macranthoides]
MLEVLDLRGNDFSGTIPAEIGDMQSLRRLLLSNNKFEGSVPLELSKLNFLSEMQFDENITCGTGCGAGCLNRKFGHCLWQSGVKSLKKAETFIIPVKGALISYLNLLPLFKLVKGSSHGHEVDCFNNLPSGLSEPQMVQNVQNLQNTARRRLVESPKNLIAAPTNGGGNIIALPSSRSSGSFPAVPGKKAHSPSPSPAPSPAGSPHSVLSSGENPQNLNYNHDTWKYVLGFSISAFSLIVLAVVFFVCRSQAAKNIGPWRTGLSGQLQKAFVTGVPKLNRSELETACEDFSNIISTHDGCTVYKGTLSSGVEIAVLSTSLTDLKDWSKRAELAFRKKIDTLSRVNHKNFVNLIGYCEEDEPFTRMMVFEYAPNGSLFEYLHVKEVEHLDWNARTRIIMGTAYCLLHMHELNPPVVHSNLNSAAVFLTDDYAAKIAEINFWKEFWSKPKGESESEHSELPPAADSETNVYNFGILLLEIISGKLPHSEEEGPLINWAAHYLSDDRSTSFMLDPTLNSLEKGELDIICDVVRECTHQDPRKRPTMKEVISKLRSVINIAPEAATPRLSPLWWAELEILSAESS